MKLSLSCRQLYLVLCKSIDCFKYVLMSSLSLSLSLLPTPRTNAAQIAHLLTPLGARTFCCSCKEILRGIALEMPLQRDFCLGWLLIVLGIFPRFGQVITLSQCCALLLLFCRPARYHPSTTHHRHSQIGSLCLQPPNFWRETAIRQSQPAERLGTTFFFGEHKRQSRRPRPKARPTRNSQRSHPWAALPGAVVVAAAAIAVAASCCSFLLNYNDAHSFHCDASSLHPPARREGNGNCVALETRLLSSQFSTLDSQLKTPTLRQC